MSTAPSKSPTTALKEGQTIKFIPRDASTEARPVPYYDFYASLYGTVAKIYDDGTAAVIVDRTSLPDDARERHEKSERDMRDKWLRSLSEDDRSKLTEIQRQFSLRYTLLVSISDLIDFNVKSPAPLVKESKKEVKPALQQSSVETSPRPTEDAIAAAEAAHLEEIARRAQQG
jgi:hypothetical protein